MRAQIAARQPSKRFGQRDDIFFHHAIDCRRDAIEPAGKTPAQDDGDNNASDDGEDSGQQHRDDRFQARTLERIGGLFQKLLRIRHDGIGGSAQAIELRLAVQQIREGDIALMAIDQVGLVV